MSPKSGREWCFLLVYASVISCSGGSNSSSIPINWQPLSSLNESLPEGIRVYEGLNQDLPLKAWYVLVDEADPSITTRVVVSEDTDRRESASSFADRLGAPVVVNGGYFRMDLEPAEHVGLLCIDRQILHPATISVRRDTIRYHTARAALGFTEEGYIDVAWVSSRNDSLFEWEEPPFNVPGTPSPPLDFRRSRLWNVRDALAAGPALLWNGSIRITSDEEVFFDSSIPQIHPRTAAGYTGDGKLVLLVVDGRQPASRGVDLMELATIMQDLGCVEAVNLDGGGSSSLVVNGVLVNRPAGGEYQREVMSALAVFYR